MNVVPVRGHKSILSSVVGQGVPKTTARVWVKVRFRSLEETRSEQISRLCFPQRDLSRARDRMNVRLKVLARGPADYVGEG